MEGPAEEPPGPAKIRIVAGFYIFSVAPTGKPTSRIPALPATSFFGCARPTLLSTTQSQRRFLGSSDRSLPVGTRPCRRPFPEARLRVPSRSGQGQCRHRHRSSNPDTATVARKITASHVDCRVPAALGLASLPAPPSVLPCPCGRCPTRRSSASPLALPPPRAVGPLTRACGVCMVEPRPVFVLRLRAEGPSRCEGAG